MPLKLSQSLIFSHYVTSLTIACIRLFGVDGWQTRCTHYTIVHVERFSPQAHLIPKSWLLMKINARSLSHWLCHCFGWKQEKKKNDQKCGRNIGWGDTGIIKTACEKKHSFYYYIFAVPNNRLGMTCQKYFYWSIIIMLTSCPRHPPQIDGWLTEFRDL